jgi:trehalose 6-phosphate phosphatase
MTDSDLLPPIPLDSFAFFFDLDGTLAPIEKRPDWVFIPDDIKQVLGKIFSSTGGALALVSGRSLSELDALCDPLKCPVAGVHGAERRDANGAIHRIEISPAAMSELGGKLKHAMQAFPGSVVEAKGMAYALHYRQAMKFEKDIHDLAQKMIRYYPQFALQPGKCVVELKPAGVDKGAAILAFMRETPFTGKTPLFIGDDLTDEAGFERVNTLDGITVKVGPGDTAAHYHLDSVTDVHDWLRSLIKRPESHPTNTIMSVGEDL